MGNNLYSNLANFYNVNDENFKEFMAEIYKQMLTTHRDVQYVKEHLTEEIVKILDKYLVDGKFNINIEEKVNEFLENNQEIKDIDAKLTTNTNNIKNITSQLDTNVKQLIDKINEVATTGTTTEVLQTTTETYIQKKLNDGTIANLTIEDNTITSEKYKDKSITVKKIDNSVYLNDVKMPYLYPAEFIWKDSPINRKIFTNGAGKFFVDFDVEELKPTSGTTYYVDCINGKNTNMGNNPYAPVRDVATAYSRSDVGEIIVYGGIYGDSNVMNGVAIKKNISIKAREGDDVYFTSNRPVTWTKMEGRTNIWQATRSVTGAIFDKKYIDSDRNWTKYPTVSDLDTLDANAGHSYITSSNIYVHTKDGREPDDDILVFLKVPNILLQEGCTVYLENIKCWGGSYPARVEVGSTLLAKNCDFRYSLESGSDGVYNVGGLSILQNCKATKNEDDGFSYDPSGEIPAKGIEINCSSWRNGSVGGNDNGSTLHEGCIAIRVNGAYWENYGPNVADVGGAQSINLGCIMANSKMTTEGSGRGVTSSTNGSYKNTKVWLDNCQVYGNKKDLHADDTCNVYVRNSYYVVSGGNEVKY